MIRGIFGALFYLSFSLCFAFDNQKSADDIIDKLTLEQKVGQFFIFGFMGSQYEQSLKKQINSLHPGAMIVFGRNITTLNQVKELNKKAQADSIKDSGVPMLIAVDQEGGNVIRIKTSPSLPSARTLALTDNEALVQEAGDVTGQLMTALGFNMNLAPVVDISNANYTDFLGNRSFSHQKEIVNKMSTAFSKGLVDAGILPTAKHFPGHGGIKGDSHLSTPYKQVTLTELMFNDLAPYKEMHSQRIPFAIMASHISYPLIDPSEKPASFSPLLLKKILRTGLGFEGIIMTDDIQMEGAKTDKMSVGERAVQAILAGNDLIMVGWNHRVQKQTVDAVLKAVKTGRITKERLEESLKRIISYKQQFYKKTSDTSLKKVLASIPLKETYDKIFHEVFRKQTPEIQGKNLKIDVYSYSWKFLTSYKEQQKSRLVHLQSFRKWKRDPSTDLIVFHLSGPTTEKILEKAPESMRKDIVVINSSSQVFLTNEAEYKKVINIHSQHPKLGSFAALHLSRSTEPRKPTAN